MAKGMASAESRRRELPALGIRFFLAAALCAARIGGGEAPFALGCVAAAGAGSGGIAALLGCGMGLLLFLDFSAGLIQLAAAILIAAAMTAAQGTKLAAARSFAPFCAGGMYLAVKGIWILQAADPLAGLPACLLTAGLSALAAWGYEPLLRREGPEEEGLRFLGMTLLTALTGAEVSGVSLGGAGVMALVVLTAWRQGMAPALETGLFGGFLLDCCAGDGLLHTAACALTGGLSGILSQGRRSRLAPALGAGLAGGLLLALLPGAEGQALLAEAALGGVLFLALPGRLLGGKRLAKSPPADALTEGVRRRIAAAAAAFRELYESLGRAPRGDLEENPAILFDRAAERVCRDCALCSLCWRKEYVGTFNAMNDATPLLLERGRALAKDFPAYFADRCIHLTEYLAAVNGELSAYLLRRQYRLRLEESRREARDQYARMGELLSAAAAELTAERPAVGEPGMEWRIGAVLRAKEGERVCGDSLESFEDREGLLYLLLSDGSGSGESARRESALTCRLLRQFLESGIQPEAALQTLNSALALRGEETGSFATIDLLTLRRESGEAVFYKYGAAPSYIKRLGSVRRLTGSSLPAGLRAAPAPPDVTRLRLESGSFAVMVSDGVADAESDEWLQDLLAGWSGEDPQALAGRILAECRKQGRSADDCAVQVLFLPESGDGVASFRRV